MNMRDVIRHIANTPEAHTPVLLCATDTTIEAVLHNIPEDQVTGMLQLIAAEREQLTREQHGALLRNAPIAAVTTFDIRHHNVTRYRTGEQQLIIQPRAVTYILPHDQAVYHLNDTVYDKNVFKHVPEQANVGRERFPLEKVYADTATIPKEELYVTLDDEGLKHKDESFTVAFLNDQNSRKARLVGADVIELNAEFSGQNAGIEASAVAFMLSGKYLQQGTA